MKKIWNHSLKIVMNYAVPIVVITAIILLIVGFVWIIDSSDRSNAVNECKQYNENTALHTYKTKVEGNTCYIELQPGIWATSVQVDGQFHNGSSD